MGLKQEQELREKTWDKFQNIHKASESVSRSTQREIFDSAWSSSHDLGPDAVMRVAVNLMLFYLRGMSDGHENAINKVQALMKK